MSGRLVRVLLAALLLAGCTGNDEPADEDADAAPVPVEVDAAPTPDPPDADVQPKADAGPGRAYGQPCQLNSQCGSELCFAGACSVTWSGW